MITRSNDIHPLSAALRSLRVAFTLPNYMSLCATFRSRLAVTRFRFPAVVLLAVAMNVASAEVSISPTLGTAINGVGVASSLIESAPSWSVFDVDMSGQDKGAPAPLPGPDADHCAHAHSLAIPIDLGLLASPALASQLPCSSSRKMQSLDSAPPLRPPII